MVKEIKAADVKLPGYSEQQVQRAVKSLITFVGDRKTSGNELFDDEDTLNLSIALKKMPLQSRKDKPIPLQLPHPIHTAEGAEVCLFVKDHKGEGHKEAKQQVQKLEGHGGITKVIGISKLKTKYESHEAKRQLCKMYDIFLADERVLPSLPKLIGKSFFKKKKQPIPIRITAKDLAAQVKQACSCTYMFKNSGTCINIKVGLSSFSQQQVAENVHAVLVQAMEHIPKKWSNVRGVFLKTADSVALPVFQTLPEQGAKIEVQTTEAKPAAIAEPASAVSAKPASAKPVSAKPDSTKPASAKPASAKPASTKPASAKPAGKAKAKK